MGSDHTVKRVPETLDGAHVLKSVDVSAAVRTFRTRHTVNGQEIEIIDALAIARYETDPGFYLFYCDDDWRVLTDTYHETMESALSQAEFEFGPVSFVDR
jgi:hypothetical protein